MEAPFEGLSRPMESHRSSSRRSPTPSKPASLQPCGRTAPGELSAQLTAYGRTLCVLSEGMAVLRADAAANLPSQRLSTTRSISRCVRSRPGRAVASAVPLSRIDAIRDTGDWAAELDALGRRLKTPEWLGGTRMCGSSTTFLAAPLSRLDLVSSGLTPSNAHG